MEGSNQLGRVGEVIAARYLKERGYTILAQNYIQRFSRSPQSGEIDIIAKKGETVSFIEVKTSFRGTDDIEDQLLEQKVNSIKQKKIIRAAEQWLFEHRIAPETRWQIDIIAIFVDRERGKAKIRYLPNTVQG